MKVTEDNIKEAEFEVMLDLTTLISKTAIDPELTPCQKQHAARRPRSRTRRIQAGIGETISSMGRCVGRRRIVVPIDIKWRQIDFLHCCYSHSGMRKMETEYSGGQRRRMTQNRK